MRTFSYVVAHSVEGAVESLVEYGSDAVPVAGGTDLLVRIKRGFDAPKTVVDLAGIRDLRGIELTEEGLRIGSLTTHAEIAKSSLVRQRAPAVAEASASVGAPQTRNLGTIGGNLASAVPSADGAPALLALDALVRLAGPNGQRLLPLEQFFVGPRLTVLTQGEILTEVVIPKEALDRASRFLKQGRRKALSLALVNAAACVKMDGDKIASAGIALGAVAPTPIRAHAAESFLVGKRPDEAVLAEAGQIATEEIKPIDDFRASAWYRRELVAVLVRRALAGSLALAVVE